MPTLNYDDLLGRTFLLPVQENGECKQAHIIEHVNHLEDSQVSWEDQLHLCIRIQNQDDFEEFISYNQLMDFLEQSSEPEELPDDYFKFRGINAHQVTLSPIIIIHLTLL